MSADGRRAAAKLAPLPLLPHLSVLLLGAALLLGGAGDDHPLLALTVELIAVATLWYIWAFRGLAPPVRIGPLPWAILCGTLALPLLQLVPLPPPLWSSLPGRELAGQILASVGLAGGWRPLSLDPAATLASALELLPLAAIFLSVLHLPGPDRRRLIYLLIAVALLSALLGGLQRTGGAPSPFILFDTPHNDRSPGLFVNRNHQATLLLIAMLMTAGMARAYGGTALSTALVRTVALTLVAVFSAGVLVTASRTGFAMLLPAAAASALVIFRIRWNAMWVASLGAAAIILGVLASQSSVVNETLARFGEVSQDERGTYWEDTIAAIGESFPAGTGFGTFPKVYETVQSVDVLGPLYVNNAHNDHLELLLEGGLLALVLAGAFLFYLVLCAVRFWRSRERPEATVGFLTLGAIAVVLVHSIFDFPLRMTSLMTAFGLLCALLAVMSASVAPRKNGARS